MGRCIFCGDEKDKLTDEHIIPKALASNVYLPKASCEQCQQICNQSFKQRFLKGSNFVAMVRAQLGIRGRRNEPVFGFDQHGHPLSIEVQPGFPPIRVGMATAGFYRPMQVILADGQSQPLSYTFLPDAVQRPITSAFFDNLVGTPHAEASVAAFWADGDLLVANAWRELLEAFVAWANRRSLIPMASSIATGAAKVPFSLDWNAPYRDRGLAKISFMYMLSLLDEPARYDISFKPIRDYLLTGEYRSTAWSHGPVLQWSGQFPLTEPELKFTYLTATVTRGRDVFGLVQLLNMGLFCVKLASTTDLALVPESLTTYSLEKDAAGNYVMTSQLHVASEVGAFAEGVRNSGLLCT